MRLRLIPVFTSLLALASSSPAPKVPTAIYNTKTDIAHNNSTHIASSDEVIQMGIFQAFSHLPNIIIDYALGLTRPANTNHSENSTTPDITMDIAPRMIFEDNPICEVFFWDGNQGGCTFLTGSRKTNICKMRAMRLGFIDDWRAGECMEVIVSTRNDDTSGVWEGCEVRRAFNVTCPEPQ